MSAKEKNAFFKCERTASEIKSELLTSCFEVWATTVLSSQAGRDKNPVLYIDLQAGQGCAEASKSVTSEQLLRSLYISTGSRVDLNQAVKPFFYDADKAALDGLQERVAQFPYYQELKHTPLVLQEEADEETLEQLLDDGHSAFTFMNPFEGAYPPKLLTGFLQSWGAGLMMLFKLSDLQAALRKARTDETLQTLLGERLTQIKGFWKKNKDTERREEYLMNCFESIFQDKGYSVFRFRVNLPDKKQTSYYLVFAFKTEQAYIRLKELMLAYSDFQEDGVPLFGANLQQQQTSLFHEHYRYSIENLVQELSQKASLYNNRTLQYIYEKHSIGTHYTLDNYKVACEKLMRQGKVRFINPKTGQPVAKLTPALLVRYK